MLLSFVDAVSHSHTGPVASQLSHSCISPARTRIDTVLSKQPKEKDTISAKQHSILTYSVGIEQCDTRVDQCMEGLTW